ncbi:MAG: hypothetical protein KDB64_11970, partial [Solirubrobacterales bacterium]|nr:hypothetical protein [Solirubrobacterales bacterium]
MAEMDARAKLAAEIRASLIRQRQSEAVGGDESIAEAIRREVEARAAMLSEATREDLVERILREASGLGPLEVLLDDSSVEEVMVNGPDFVYVERNGRIEPAGIS